jgi:hypothetical protein
VNNNFYCDFTRSKLAAKRAVGQKKKKIEKIALLLLVNLFFLLQNWVENERTTTLKIFQVLFFLLRVTAAKFERKKISYFPSNTIFFFYFSFLDTLQVKV